MGRNERLADSVGSGGRGDGLFRKDKRGCSSKEEPQLGRKEEGEGGEGENLKRDRRGPVPPNPFRGPGGGVATTKHTGIKRQKGSEDTPPTRKILKKLRAQEQPGTYAKATDSFMRAVVAGGYPEVELP